LSDGQIRDDESRSGVFAQVLGHTHDSSFAGPTFQRLVGKVDEDARGLLSLLKLLLRALKFFTQNLVQAFVFANPSR
jgi:hypothetical protein